MFGKTVLGAVAALALSAGMAAAATIGFTINPGASSVTLSKSGSGGLCSLTSCGIAAQVVAPASSFQLGTGDTKTFDFLKFTGKGTGGVSYNVSATLAFSAPSGADTTGDGDAGALLIGGSIVGGFLTWNNLPKNITLSDGSKISVDFQGGIALLEGKSVTTSASVHGKDIKGPAPIPVPPAALLLVGGLGSLGGLGFAGRRKRAA